ncbi:MAG: hypothetical protein ACJ72Z_12405 [Pyrinomonadaceae bacterium]
MKVLLALVVLAATILSAGCSNTSVGNQGSAPSKVFAAPAKDLTDADVAKLKWIEGEWKGIDDDKPFYERYRFEGSSMVVESLKDEKLEVEDADRFELIDGEFGKGEGEDRSAASEITDTYVQFVPAIKGTGNSFRFERVDNNTWNAILEWEANEKRPAGRKVYVMQRVAQK